MGDMAEYFRDLRDHKKAIRKRYGVLCPECQIVRPKAHPTILLPGQRCRVDGYKDSRPQLTNEEWSNP